MRGKRWPARRLTTLRRIIPARAGQTTSCTSHSKSRPDHPRACGANLNASSSQTARNGSSPRVRGKPGRGFDMEFEHRIIPARAGQTLTCHSQSFGVPDHPRACGANEGRGSDARIGAGSSPRVRGKPRAKTCRRLEGRIIPARAGQTLTRPSDGVEGTDHPRACGANSAVFLILSMEAGSSPRVRGKRRHR